MGASRYDLLFDGTGELLDGLFYRLSVNRPSFVADYMSPRRNRIQGVLASGVDEECLVQGEVIADWNANYEGRVCTVTSHRRTGRGCLRGVRLYGGSACLGLIPCDDSEFVLVASDAASRIEKEEWKGGRIEQLCDVENDAELSGEFSVWQLLFTGAECERPGFRVRSGVANQCPFCGFGPVICEECGRIMAICEKCNQAITTATRSPASEKLCFEPYPEDGGVIDATRWDGSDFVYPDLVSGRVVQAFHEWGLAPFIAEPMRVCVDRVCESTRTRLLGLRRREQQ